MNGNHLGARIIISVAIVNLVFQLGMLAFNIIGIPLGLIH